jgi:hypothetical protein
MAFDLLRLIADGAKVPDDIENRLCKPFLRHISSIIELQGQQHLESPPIAAHRLFFPTP